MNPSSRCFLALPPGPDFEALRVRLVTQLTAADIEVIAPPWRSVEEAVQGADVVIADITGGDANVMFEVGVAAGMRKPILALARYGTQLPIDLRSYRVIQYEAGDPRLQKYVESWLYDAIVPPRSLA